MDTKIDSLQRRLFDAYFLRWSASERASGEYRPYTPSKHRIDGLPQWATAPSEKPHAVDTRRAPIHDSFEHKVFRDAIDINVALFDWLCGDAPAELRQAFATNISIAWALEHHLKWFWLATTQLLEFDSHYLSVRHVALQLQYLKPRKGDVFELSQRKEFADAISQVFFQKARADQPGIPTPRKLLSRYRRRHSELLDPPDDLREGGLPEDRELALLLTRAKLWWYAAPFALEDSWRAEQAAAASEESSPGSAYSEWDLVRRRVVGALPEIADAVEAGNLHLATITILASECNVKVSTMERRVSEATKSYGTMPTEALDDHRDWESLVSPESLVAAIGSVESPALPVTMARSKPARHEGFGPEDFEVLLGETGLLELTRRVQADRLASTKS